MSKYVIEIEEKPLCVFDKDTQTYFPRLWRVKGFNSLVLDEEGLSRLEELNSDYINEYFSDLQDDAYDKGYAQCQDDYSDALKHAKDVAYKKGLHDGESKCGYCNEYQRGFEDGKAVNDKGCEGCKYAEMGSDTTICAECCNAYNNQWTAKDDKIEVGDEVEVLNSGNKYLIAWFAGTSLCGFAHDGVTCRLQPSDVRKTGRHFDIQSILEAMKHD